MIEASDSLPEICCTQCRARYPKSGVPYVCPQCGGIYDFDRAFLFRREDIDPQAAGIWRYRQAFALPVNAPVVTLGEGNTPLLPVEENGKTVWLKLESLNPTGSYKDRGSAVLLSALLARGVTQAVEDSSGNAGASFAAYAARAGLHARVFVPESASGPKRSQIERYGADLLRVPGSRSAAAEAVLREVRQGAVYASHAYLPFGLAGIATMAYELWQQLGRAPGTVIAPVGHGGLLLGLVRGFASLQQAGWIDQIPDLIGVQAQACAPVVAAERRNLSSTASLKLPLNAGETIAEGVRVAQPIRAEALLNEIPARAGRFVAIDEPAIAAAFHALARKGVYVEPTSALAWAAYRQSEFALKEPVVLILTGTGLKYQTQA